MGALPDWKIRELCGGVEKEEDYRYTYKPSKPLLEPFLDYTEQDIMSKIVVSSGLTSHGYDLRLGWEAKKYNRDELATAWPKGIKETDYDTVSPVSDGFFIMSPWSALLTHSVEYFRMPNNIEAHAIGKSTYARLNIFINTTPIEAGWEGNLTIEIVNLSHHSVALKAGEGICQVKFYSVEPPERSYKGKYQGSKGVQIAL